MRAVGRAGRPGRGKELRTETGPGGRLKGGRWSGAELKAAARAGSSVFTLMGSTERCCCRPARKRWWCRCWGCCRASSAGSGGGSTGGRWPTRRSMGWGWGPGVSARGLGQPEDTQRKQGQLEHLSAGAWLQPHRPPSGSLDKMTEHALEGPFLTSSSPRPCKAGIFHSVSPMRKEAI